MKTRYLITLLMAFGLAFQVITAPVVQAQGAPMMPGEKPIMENVFFNVVWGSVLGMLLGTSAATIESDVKTQPTDLSNRVALGATWGGILGLGIGIWLATNGITFDPGAALFDTGGRRAPMSSLDPTFRLETSPDEPMKVTGVHAKLLAIRF